MDIIFENTKPSYINLEQNKHDSELWGKKYVFEKCKNYHLIAPSGRGKTSFINLLCFENEHYEGDISINNKSLKQISDKEKEALLRNNFSFVFQDLKLVNDWNVLENIQSRSCLNLDKYNENILYEYAYKMGIKKLFSQKTNTLSMGEKQRVAILRGISYGVDFLFLDEPFSHLDIENSKIAFECILDFSIKNNTSIIYLDLDKNILANNFKLIYI